MLEGTGLTWIAAVFGGDVVASGIAALAIERGGTSASASRTATPHPASPATSSS